ncbi:ribonucleoside-diphosphate reductase [Synchytrium microbalum]|uniref:Ribonucleoside-diphosphate reductase n=1 Tax=Synchytrium microbalum TaxID=1806994 RepID=A0A507CFM2_9FUNG|nr:ribonucleoside-diphosphate reductase [Synchytrium microbalum]TPX38158.1 ribonucleoside-diphosphate reductase [Synchytrium microbalum]
MLAGDSSDFVSPRKQLSNNISKLALDEDWDDVGAITKSKLASYKEEAILKHNPKRFVLFPIQYHEIWQGYKNCEAKFWSAEEIELSDDAEGWNKLSGKERTFVLQCLSLLGTGDGGDNINRLNSEIQIPEARCFYGFQIMQRHVHLELIGVLTDLFSTRPDDREIGLTAIKELSAVQKRSAWLATHVLESDEHFSNRNAAVAIFMNVFMCTIGAALLHLTRPGEKRTHCTPNTPLPGMIRALAKVQRDIDTYDAFCNLVARHMVNRPTQQIIHRLTADAVAIEKQLITELFGLFGGSVKLVSTTLDLARLTKYVEVVADRALVRLGLAKLYNTDPASALPEIDTVLKEEKDKEEQASGAVSTGAVTKTDASMNTRQEFSISEDF